MGDTFSIPSLQIRAFSWPIGSQWKLAMILLYCLEFHSTVQKRWCFASTNSILQQGGCAEVLLLEGARSYAKMDSSHRQWMKNILERLHIYRNCWKLVPTTATMRHQSPFICLKHCIIMNGHQTKLAGHLSQIPAIQVFDTLVGHLKARS